MNGYAVIAAGTAVALGIGIFLVWNALRAARKRGEVEAKWTQARTQSEQARRANEIDEGVARLSDADLDRELRDGR